VGVYVVIKTADAKAACKSGAGQQPSCSFPNLISHLATLSRNDLAGLAIAVRLYGALAATSGPSVHDQLTAGLESYLAVAGISRTGSASCWVPTTRPGRWAGRCGAS
jgi:C4-dicarboxylate transporter